MHRGILDQLRTDIAAHLKVTPEEVTLSSPPKPEFGDCALVCFPLAKKLKKNPEAIAQEFAVQLQGLPGILSVEALGAFVNIRLPMHAKLQFIGHTLKEWLHPSKVAVRGPALIEHTSINPNAPPHVGRARNAITGDAMKRLLIHAGYAVETHYFVNDVGKQVAVLLIGLEERPGADFDELLKIYIDINARMKTDTTIEKRAFELLAKLEAGDMEVRAKFRDVIAVCLKGQVGLLNELGIQYDKFDYESDYVHGRRLPEILQLLQNKGRIIVDQNQQCLDLTGFNLPCEKPILPLTRSDGTSLYQLRDIAYTLDKMTWSPHKNVIVLGPDQKLYFQQIAAALTILGSPAPEVYHHAMVNLPGTGKMSTRQGTLVLLQDFMRETLAKAAQEIEAKGLAPEQKEKAAKQVAYGALKFSILRVSHEKDVVFNWKDALSFDGESGPSIQYTHARICSLLEKVPHDPLVHARADDLTGPYELAVVKKMLDCIDAVEDASVQLKPHQVANSVYQVAKAFNEFYQNCPIREAESPSVREGRRQIAQHVKTTIAYGLGLLGIEAPVRM